MKTFLKLLAIIFFFIPLMLLLRFGLGVSFCKFLFFFFDSFVHAAILIIISTFIFLLLIFDFFICLKRRIRKAESIDDFYDQFNQQEVTSNSVLR